MCIYIYVYLYIYIYISLSLHASPQLPQTLFILSKCGKVTMLGATVRPKTPASPWFRCAYTDYLQ